MAGLLEHMVVLPGLGIREDAAVLLAHYGVIASALALRSYDKFKGTAVDSAGLGDDAGALPGSSAVDTPEGDH